MLEDSAAAMTVCDAPRLTLSCLRGLRLELDACLSSLRGDSRPEVTATCPVSLVSESPHQSVPQAGRVADVHAGSGGPFGEAVARQGGDDDIAGRVRSRAAEAADKIESVRRAASEM